MFCQQDRAILCRDCDLPIHSVNELTQKHDRFLLTGVQLSCISAANLSSSSSEAASFVFNSEPNNPFHNSTAIPHSPSSIAESSTSNAPMAAASAVDFEPMNGVSEYLIQAHPAACHFDQEFLDSSSTAAPPPFGFCKVCNSLI